MAEALNMVKENILGIDFGSAAVKIGEGSFSETGVRVSKVAFRQIISHDTLSEQASAQIIKEMIMENQIGASSAFFVLNGPQCQIRVMTLPKMSDDLLEKTIRSEIKKELSQPLEDYKIDFKTCREFEVKSEEGINQKKVETIVTAIDNKTISRYCAIAENAGLKCAGFIPAAIGLFSFSKKSGMLSGIGENEVIMFLDFGNSQMSVNFISSNGLRFSKEINMGGSALTTVVKTMHSDETLSVEAAEGKKFKIGLMAQDAVDALSDSSPNANLHKVLNLSFKKLFQRLRLSTGYYFAHFRDSTLSSQVMKQIIIAGGNSEIPGIASFFDDAFDAAVAKADSWKAVDNGECNLSVCEQYNLSFLNLCAAFCEYYTPEYKINISNARPAPAKQKSDNETKFNDFIASNAPGLQSISNYKFVNIVAAALIFYIIVFASISVYDMASIFSYNSQKSAFEAKFNELNSPSAADERNKINERYAAFNKKKTAREVIEFKKNSLDKTLASISAQLPDGTIISSLNFINEVKPVLILNGSAGEYAKVITFSDELKKNGSFSKVSMKKSEQKASRVEFQFDCELGTGKGN